SFADNGIVALRAVFVDDDDAEPPITFELLEKAGLAPNIVVESANGKHAYWLLAPAEDLSDFGPMQKALARKFGTDQKGSNLSRVMRLAGFVHRKDPTALHVVWVSHVDTSRRHTMRAIADAFSIKTTEPEPNPA